MLIFTYVLTHSFTFCLNKISHTFTSVSQCYLLGMHLNFFYMLIKKHKTVFTANIVCTSNVRKTVEFVDKTNDTTGEINRSRICNIESFGKGGFRDIVMALWSLNFVWRKYH